MDEATLAPEHLDRTALRALQLDRLRAQLDLLLRDNPFQRRRLRAAGLERAAALENLDELRRLPFTTKDELVADQRAHPPYGSNLTFPVEVYTRVHQTSGTGGEPLRWLDTEASWAWWARCWQVTYRAAGVTAADRVFFAFSFGPYVGLWAGFEGLRRVGALALPGGGLSTQQRVRAIAANGVTVVVATPSYALRLAEVAEQLGVDLPGSAVRRTIHAGEPGASLRSTRAQLEARWGARCYDHAGSTAVGAWGFECEARAGLHLNEAEFIVEVIDPASGRPADEGELVVTNLGRVGMPVLRYRTGDRVRLARTQCPCGRSFARLDGGVIGRIDDALGVRGVQVFPSAIEDVVRRHDALGEFAVDVYRGEQLDEIEVRVELRDGANESVVSAVAAALRDALGLRVGVRGVRHGTLPAFSGGTPRVVDHRGGRES